MPRGSELERAETAERAVVLAEKGKLQKQLGRVDVFFYLLCTLVGLDAYGAVATYGAQSFTWLVFLCVFFLLPYALITVEVGSAFTDEGGPYVWVRLAFGRFAASVGTVFYWLSNTVWLGGSLTITAIAAYNTFFPPLPHKGAINYVFGLAFIWFAVGSAILSLNVGKWVPAIGAIARLVLLPLFTITVGVYAWKHGLHGFQAHDFAPTYPVFVGAIPLLFFDLVGFELPSAAAEEMKNPQRDVPLGIARSAVGAILLYGVPMLAILLVLPQKQITGLHGFLDAIKVVFTVYGGHIAADGTVTLQGAGLWLGYLMGALVIAVLASSGTTWAMGSDRIQAIAALDGAGPRFLGRFSQRYGTPMGVNLCTGIVSTVLMILAMTLSGGDAEKYFQAMLGLTVIMTAIAYLLIFPACVWLRRTHPNMHRPYRVPGGPKGAWICVILLTFWTLFSTVTLVWPGLGAGWFGTSGSPDAALPAGFHRMEYELMECVPILVTFLVGVGFYYAGKHHLQQSADSGESVSANE